MVWKKNWKEKKKKYKIQKGSGLLNGFKLLYSIGKNWRNSMQWGEKKNYAMMKLNVPKRVTLPNGKTFVARYKRIPRDQLPPNIVMRRTVPRGRRRRQCGRGIFDFV